MNTLRRSIEVVSEELAEVRPRLLFARLLAAPLPNFVGRRLRATILRLGGSRVGRGVAIAGMPRLFGEGQIASRLTIGDHCIVSVGVTFELGAHVDVGHRVAIGPDAMFLTTGHEVGPSQQRWSTVERAPIRIGDGAWIGARTVVLPGVIIGAGAVVGASSLVTRDVEPDTVVAGVPARVLRQLEEEAVDVVLEHEYRG